MEKITLQVEGMVCSMCEAHINDAVRRAFAVKKVSSSRSKGTTEVITEQPIDTEALKAAIDATGYTVTGCRVEPYTKKGFSLFGR
ncbi:MAG: heavy-metal-associated domain-containing protein [Clostridia bacterium]|nr:heavy-metal-associated domain-containing protein [Clostridia bacterium]